MDSLPRGEVRGVLIAVFPDGAPRLKDGADLRRCGQAVLEEAANHEGVGFRVEGVELGGDVRLRVDDVELGLHCLVWLVVRVGLGFGLVGGEEKDGEGRKRTISGREKEDGSSSWDSG